MGHCCSSDKQIKKQRQRKINQLYNNNPKFAAPVSVSLPNIPNTLPAENPKRPQSIVDVMRRGDDFYIETTARQMDHHIDTVREESSRQPVYPDENAPAIRASDRVVERVSQVTPVVSPRLVDPNKQVQDIIASRHLSGRVEWPVVTSEKITLQEIHLVDEGVGDNEVVDSAEVTDDENVGEIKINQSALEGALNKIKPQVDERVLSVVWPSQVLFNRQWATSVARVEKIRYKFNLFFGNESLDLLRLFPEYSRLAKLNIKFTYRAIIGTQVLKCHESFMSERYLKNLKYTKRYEIGGSQRISNSKKTFLKIRRSSLRFLKCMSTCLIPQNFPNITGVSTVKHMRGNSYRPMRLPRTIEKLDLMTPFQTARKAYALMKLIPYMNHLKNVHVREETITNIVNGGIEGMYRWMPNLNLDLFLLIGEEDFNLILEPDSNLWRNLKQLVLTTYEFGNPYELFFNNIECFRGVESLTLLGEAQNNYEDEESKIRLVDFRQVPNLRELVLMLTCEQMVLLSHHGTIPKQLQKLELLISRFRNLKDIENMINTTHLFDALALSLNLTEFKIEFLTGMSLSESSNSPPMIYLEKLLYSLPDTIKQLNVVHTSIFETKSLINTNILDIISTRFSEMEGLSLNIRGLKVTDAQLQVYKIKLSKLKRLSTFNITPLYNLLREYLKLGSESLSVLNLSFEGGTITDDLVNFLDSIEQIHSLEYLKIYAHQVRDSRNIFLPRLISIFQGCRKLREFYLFWGELRTKILERWFKELFICKNSLVLGEVAFGDSFKVTKNTLVGVAAYD